MVVARNKIKKAIRSSMTNVKVMQEFQEQQSRGGRLELYRHPRKQVITDIWVQTESSTNSPL